MNTFVVLLRGINVGGHNKIKMAELKALLEKNKFNSVVTYIQSGNILVKSPTKSESEVSEIIKDLIQKKYGYTISVLCLLQDHFLKIYKDQPWKDRVEEEIKMLHVTICQGDLMEDQFSKLEDRCTNGEELQLVNDAIYLYCPNGYAKTKITNPSIERLFQVRATTRNWNTMTKLSILLDDY